MDILVNEDDLVIRNVVHKGLIETGYQCHSIKYGFTGFGQGSTITIRLPMMDDRSAITPAGEKQILWV